MTASRGASSFRPDGASIPRGRVLAGIAGVYLAFACVSTAALGTINIFGAGGTSSELWAGEEELFGLAQLLSSVFAIVAVADTVRRRRSARAVLSMVPMVVLAAIQTLYGEGAVGLSIIFLVLFALYLRREGFLSSEDLGAPGTSTGTAQVWPYPGGTSSGHEWAVPAPAADDGYGRPQAIPAPRQGPRGARSIAAAGVLIIIVALMALTFGTEQLISTIEHHRTYIGEGPSRILVEDKATFSPRNLVMGLLFVAAFLLGSVGAYHAMSRTDLDKALWLPMVALGPWALGCLFYTVYYLIELLIPVVVMDVAAFLIVSSKRALFAGAGEGLGGGQARQGRS